MRSSMTSKVAIVALVWSLSVAVGWPQQTDQQPANQPVPAPPTSPQAPAAPPGNAVPLGGPGAPPAQGESSGTPAEAAGPADTRSLAGAEAITPSLPGGGRSYILPSFSVWQGADTNAQIVAGNSKVQVATIPVASLSLNDVGRRNLFTLQYQGGAMIYDTDSSLSAVFQEFGFTDKYTAARWNVLIGDHISYLPQASLGFGGIGFAGALGGQSLGLGGGIGLNSAYIPGQSILTSQAGTTTNTAIAQAQYNFTPRTSLTAVGSFGVVHYSQAGLSSGNDGIFSLSYDHYVTSYDTLSLSYSFSALRFNGGLVAINSNLLRVGYGHRVTNRLTMTLLGGPELTQSAITGISGVRNYLSWTAQATLGYQVERGSLSAHYLHYVSPGSGVFNGAITDNVDVNMSRELSRTWNASLGGGYARNTPLGTFSINRNFSNPGSFGYEFGMFRVDRTFSHFARGFFVYNLQREESGMALIPGSNGRVIIRHIFGVGFELHPRPWPI